MVLTLLNVFNQMNKVLSAIKSLECVDILQVNVKEDKEVVHSGHGSASSPGYVKKGEIETDAPKNAEDPVQDINNRSESNEEDREPPVHTGTSSERKRSAASDASTTLHKTRKKIKTRKKTSTKQPKTGFDERCNQLLRFKEEFGHCNVPRRYNPSLAHCCSAMRQAYKKRQQGMKTNYTLSQDRIERLEEIGFQWQGVDYDKVSDERCRQLIAFKEEFGHCNVPVRYSGNPSLGQWCHKMRHVYKKIQKGMKTNYTLSQDRIERLEEIGFQWQGVDYDKAFEKRCRELIAFKEEFGHCNVPQKYAGNPSLGRWCNTMRNAYKKIQKGMATDSNLSQDRIESLEELGFQWQGC